MMMNLRNLRDMRDVKTKPGQLSTKNPCHNCPAKTNCKDNKNGRICDSVLKEWLEIASGGPHTGIDGHL